MIGQIINKPWLYAHCLLEKEKLYRNSIRGPNPQDRIKNELNKDEMRVKMICTASQFAMKNCIKQEDIESNRPWHGQYLTQIPLSKSKFFHVSLHFNLSYFLIIQSLAWELGCNKPRPVVRLESIRESKSTTSARRTFLIPRVYVNVLSADWHAGRKLTKVWKLFKQEDRRDKINTWLSGFCLKKF